MIESPVANDSITNKQASQKESIYHTCRSVLNALKYVKGFEVYMEDINNVGTDPLTKIWYIFRQGSSLCYLFNTLKPDTPIMINKNSSAANKSKAYVYHFIIACRDQLNFPQDTLFTVTELLQQDTNKLVKVVNTVKRILDLLENEGIISVTSLEDEITDSPKDMRDNVVYELISTERKYVQDLESLQSYMKEVSAQEILSQDTMHYLFGNLNALVDFQRRFLIQMEEQVVNVPMEQRFGSLFIQFEEDFSVYEPFCANFQIAQDLVIQEAPKLQRLSNIMSPTYELPAMLIKPIQRVCKYPLLIQQLIKSTPDDWPHLEETKLGLEVILRITKKVNETKRVQENILLVQDLRKRITDDHSAALIIDSAGQLLLHDKFNLQKNENDNPREVQAFLFQKIILICKEVKDVNKNSISIKKKRKEGSMIVRGKVLLSRIEHVKGSSTQNTNYTLHLSWMENDMQTVLLKCRNDEQLRQWLDAIIDLKKSSTKLDFFPSNNNSLLYDEDEDDDYYNSDDDENAHIVRNRSYSYQYVQNRVPEVTSRKASLPNATINRHFNGGVPGMTLPPLPRSPTTTVTNPNELSVFPSSPPISYPSSPTNNNMAPSGSLWQRRQNHNQKIQEIQEDLPHIRARSKSSPNIQRPVTAPQDIPPFYYDRRKSNGYKYDENVTKLKIHYIGSIYVVVVPTNIGFSELLKRIENKIKLCGQEFESSMLGLKYEDEDGDLITISSSEDVQMGFENKGPNNSVNLYVT